MAVVVVLVLVAVLYFFHVGRRVTKRRDIHPSGWMDCFSLCTFFFLFLFLGGKEQERTKGDGGWHVQSLESYRWAIGVRKQNTKEEQTGGLTSSRKCVWRNFWGNVRMWRPWRWICCRYPLGWKHKFLSEPCPALKCVCVLADEEEGSLRH